MMKSEIQKVNFTRGQIGVQTEKIRLLKKIGVDSLKNLRKIKIGGSNMRKNSGKIMDPLQNRISRKRNHNNSRLKHLRLILEYKLTKAYA